MTHHVYPIVPDIGLVVHKTFEVQHTYFDRLWYFKVRSQSEANIARSCLTYYRAMWDGKLCPALSQQDVVVDIGAHVGFFAIPVASQVGVLIAYEPAPANYKLLRANARRNQAHNLVASPQAVAGTAGLVQLSLGVQGTTGHSIVARKRGGVSIQVEAVDLSQIVKLYKPTVLKLDCEGAEWGILTEPELLGGIRLLIAELHKVSAVRLKGMRAVLRHTGFKVIVQSNSWFSKLTAYKEQK
jgi:FkbM family methyltransferase